MKKGQIGFEYLVIMGFITFIIVGILGVSFVYSSGIKDRLKIIQLNNFGNKISSSAESVFNMGEPSKVTMRLYLPENVNDIEIIENSIIISVQLNSGITRTSFSSNVPIEGNLTHSSGIKNIEIKALYDKIIINEVSP